MKKILSLISILMVTFSVVGCSSSNTDSASSENNSANNLYNRINNGTFIKN